VAHVIAPNGWRKFAGACCLLCAENDHAVRIWIDRQVGQIASCGAQVQGIVIEDDPAALSTLPSARLEALRLYLAKMLPIVEAQVNAIQFRAALLPDNEE